MSDSCSKKFITKCCFNGKVAHVINLLLLSVSFLFIDIALLQYLALHTSKCLCSPNCLNIHYNFMNSGMIFLLCPNYIFYTLTLFRKQKTVSDNAATFLDPVHLFLLAIDMYICFYLQLTCRGFYFTQNGIDITSYLFTSNCM